MERLSKGKIQFVKQFTRDGLTYNYWVMTKDMSTISYCNRDKEGNMTSDYYDFENLPKCLQKFVQEKYKANSYFRIEEWFEEDDLLKHKYVIYTFE